MLVEELGIVLVASLDMIAEPVAQEFHDFKGKGNLAFLEFVFEFRDLLDKGIMFLFVGQCLGVVEL
jgi:hypothetical protein